ncbi:3695_t:CDS:2, partial [Acaulospora colombiana]
MPRSRSQKYTIFCVIPSHSETSFYVKVKPSITVGELKGEIVKKKPHILGGIDTDELKLYRVDIADEENVIRDTVQNLSGNSTATLIRPAWPLLDVYPTTPPKKKIHIVVVSPSAGFADIVPYLHPDETPLPSLDQSPDLGASPDLFIVRSKIDEFLAQLRPKIKKFLESPRLPNWSPPEGASEEAQTFYQELAIPLIKGSGKTRILFEGLCHKWGFYFVAAQGLDRIGSRDLEAMTQRMSRSRGWIEDIFRASNPSRANDINEGIAFNRIWRVLIARWTIFQAFIDVARSCYDGKLPYHIKHDWLLFQTLPLVLVDNRDPFVAFISTCLPNVDDEVLDSLDKITPEKVLGHDFDSQHDRFFYVLDEVQVAGRKYDSCFLNASGQKARPVLRPIIRKMTEITSIGVIVSGTGFSLDNFKDILTSGISKASGKEDDWIVQYRTGDFILQESQLSYIHRGEELLQGNWNQEGPSSPHKILNAYIKALSNFDPIDAAITLLDSEPSILPLTIPTFEWEKIDKEPGLLDILAKSIYDLLTRGVYPLWFPDHKSLVEYGLGRFPTEDAVEIIEPLAIISLIRHFESKGKTLTGNILANLQVNKGTAFEEVILWAMTRLLQNRIKLKDILEFKGPVPEWAHCTAQIISGSPNGFVDFDIINEQPVSPGTGTAFYGDGVEWVKFWLEEGEAGWCLPDRYMGPDLMARVRLSNGEIMLLVIQVKCRRSGNVKTLAGDVTGDAIQSLIPHRWYCSTVCKTLSSTVPV